MTIRWRTKLEYSLVRLVLQEKNLKTAKGMLSRCSSGELFTILICCVMLSCGKASLAFLFQRFQLASAYQLIDSSCVVVWIFQSVEETYIFFYQLVWWFLLWLPCLTLLRCENSSLVLVTGHFLMPLNMALALLSAFLWQRPVNSMNLPHYICINYFMLGFIFLTSLQMTLLLQLLATGACITLNYLQIRWINFYQFNES